MDWLAVLKQPSIGPSFSKNKGDPSTPCHIAISSWTQYTHFQAEWNHQNFQVGSHWVGSNWVASPIVFSQKNNDMPWIYVDYRILNRVTGRDSCSIPHTEVGMELLSEAARFLTLDANSSYWQGRIFKGDWAKTEFASHNELFQFICRQFGLRNEQGKFQREMKVHFVYRPLAGRICLLAWYC